MGGWFSVGGTGKKKFVSKRKGNVIVPPGKHYYFTICYAFYFLAGAFAGYGKLKSMVCLLGSGSCGLVTLLTGIAHFIDHRRGNVEIEKLYIALPLIMSFIIAVMMSCFFGLGAKFMPSGFVAIFCWIGTAYYIYAVVRDWGTRVLDHDKFLSGGQQSRWMQLSAKPSSANSASKEEKKSLL
jgi:hypothetical protein